MDFAMSAFSAHNSESGFMRCRSSAEMRFATLGADSTLPLETDFAETDIVAIPICAASAAATAASLGQ
jgi:hypothetical protein